MEVGSFKMGEKFIQIAYPNYVLYVHKTKEFKAFEDRMLNQSLITEDDFLLANISCINNNETENYVASELLNSRLEMIYNEYLYEHGFIDFIRSTFKDFVWSTRFKSMVEAHVGSYGLDIVSSLQAGEGLREKIFEPLMMDIKNSTHMFEQAISTASLFNSIKYLPEFEIEISQKIGELQLEGTLLVRQCEIFDCLKYGDHGEMVNSLKSLSSELLWFANGYIMAETKINEAVSRFRYINQFDINVYVFKKQTEIVQKDIKMKLEQYKGLDQRDKFMELIRPFEEELFQNLPMNVSFWEFIQSHLLYDAKLGYQELQLCLDLIAKKEFHGTQIKDIVDAATASGFNLI